MPRTRRYTRVIQLNVDEELFARIAAVARTEKLDVSPLIRQVLARQFTNQEG